MIFVFSGKDTSSDPGEYIAIIEGQSWDHAMDRFNNLLNRKNRLDIDPGNIKELQIEEGVIFDTIQRNLE